MLNAPPTFDVLCGDAYATLCALPANFVQCVVTSVPYWMLRDYGVDGQIGLEPLPEYIEKIGRVFDEVRRVLRDDGTCWLNIGDSYIGSGKGGAGASSVVGAKHHEARNVGPRTPVSTLKPKDLAMVPARVAIELQSRGWWLRDDVIWHKTNPMPEPVADRPTRSHEFVFLLSKSASYFYNAEAVKQRTTGTSHARKAKSASGKNETAAADAAAAYTGDAKHRKISGFNERWKKGRSREGAADAFGTIVEMRNLRDVWDIPTVKSSEEHYAMFPPEVPRRCILAGSRPGDLVLDPFSGMGTTGIVALELSRSYLGIELDPKAAARSRQRARHVTPAHPALLAQQSTGRVA